MATMDDSTINTKYNSHWNPFYVKVQGCYFNVPKAKIINAKMCPGKPNIFVTALNANAEVGKTTKDAVVLDDVLHKDFECFLSFLYPSEISTSVTQADWLVVLKLSTKWHFQEIRKLAIDKLGVPEKKGGLSDIQRVLTGSELYILSWFQDGLVGIVKSKALINTEMAKALGQDWALRLYQIRDRFINAAARTDADGATNYSTGTSYHSVTADILKVFQAEIDTIKTLSAAFDLQEDFPQAIVTARQKRSNRPSLDSGSSNESLSLTRTEGPPAKQPKIAVALAKLRMVPKK